MWQKIKPYLIVVGFVAAVAAIGLMLYFFFFAPIPETGNLNTNTGSGGQFPGIGGNRNIPTTNEGGGLPNVNGTNQNINGGATGNENINAAPTTQVPVAISTAPTLGGEVSSDGKGFVYYDKSTGKFYQTSEDGRRRALSDQVFPEASNVVISPDANKAVVQFPDGSNIVYDFAKQQQYSLPKEGKDFSFNSASDQIAYKFIAPDPENRYLVASGLDGSSFKLIEPLGSEDRDVQVTWSPTGQVAALFRKGVDADRQEVFFIGTQGENFKSMLVPGRDFKGEWSPQGDRLLYSVYTADADFKPTLWIAEAQGDRIGLNRVDLGVQTWVDKCTFDTAGVTAYCAVPQSLPQGAGLVRELADSIPDTMYKIDLRTGAKSPITNVLGNFTAENVFLSDDGQTLFYTDKQTGFVYRVRL